MRITPNLRKWLVENRHAKADATDDELVAVVEHLLQQLVDQPDHAKENAKMKLEFLDDGTVEIKSDYPDLEMTPLLRQWVHDEYLRSGQDDMPDPDEKSDAFWQDLAGEAIEKGTLTEKMYAALTKTKDDSHEN